MSARPVADPLGLAAGLATALTWGLVGTLVRTLAALTPMQVVGGRLAFALAAALPVLGAASARTHVWRTAGRRDGWMLGALMSAYYLLAVIAFRLSPVADVALLFCTAPLFALALRAVVPGWAGPDAVHRTRAGERRGALIALAGVALTLVPSFEASLQASLAGGAAAGGPALGRLGGDVLALAAAAASALYASIFRRAQQRGDAPAPFGVAVLTFALGTTLLALRAVVAGDPLVPVAALVPRNALLLAVLGVVSTFVPTLAFAIAARRLPPVLTAAAQLLVPIVSAATAFVVLHEIPSPWLVPGAALIFAGLAVMLRA